MASIVFTAPRHLEPSIVITWAPGVLFVHNLPRRLYAGVDYVYVCNRNLILFRAKFIRPQFLDDKETGEGEHRGPGWSLEVGKPELPPYDIPYRGHTGFSYLDAELW